MRKLVAATAVIALIGLLLVVHVASYMSGYRYGAAAVAGPRGCVQNP